MTIQHNMSVLASSLVSVWWSQGTGDDQDRGTPTLLEAGLADDHVMKVNWAGPHAFIELGLGCGQGERLFIAPILVLSCWTAFWALVAWPRACGPLQAAELAIELSHLDGKELGLLLPPWWPAAFGTYWCWRSAARPWPPAGN